jgi:threonine dehydrogenase-like Zn-dependent dehydrogenase
LSTWPKTMQIMEKIVPELKRLVTHRVQLNEINEAIDLLKARACMKVIIEPNASVT